MHTTQVKSTDRTDDLKASEAGRMLSCSDQMIRKLAKSGELPGSYTVGSHLRIPRASVDAYKARRAVAAPAPRQTTQATNIVTA